MRKPGIELISGSILGLTAGFLAGLLHQPGSDAEPSVRVYGCGMSCTVQFPPDDVWQVHDVIVRVQPVPASASHVMIQTTEGNYSGTIAEAGSTNGVGRVPLFGGENILFVSGSDPP